MLFSQRKGLKPIKSVIQVDSMDEALRVGLWNVLTLWIWDTMKDAFVSQNAKIQTLCKVLWINYFKKPMDTIDNSWYKTHGQIKAYFFGCDWNEVYDFIETILEICQDDLFDIESIENSCNAISKKESSGYRLVKGKFIQITSEEEIAAIEEALEKTTPLKPVYMHLKTALGFLSDRTNPDYRNSIKESISSVEAICRLITGNPKATLGQALKKLKDNKVELHPALEKSFECMYGYTNDAEGIRHSLMEETTLKFGDAKFMLVSCSAFINYLVEKSSNKGDGSIFLK